MHGPIRHTRSRTVAFCNAMCPKSVYYNYVIVAYDQLNIMANFSIATREFELFWDSLYISYFKEPQCISNSINNMLRNVHS